MRAKRRLGAGFLVLLVAGALFAAAGPSAGAATFVQEWGVFGTGPGQFFNPSGVAVDAAGDVYVVDNLNDRVQKFGGAGAFVGQWNGGGSEEGQFLAPTGIAIDSAGFVFVLDQGNDRVQKFTGGGAFVHEWGSQGSGQDQLLNPEGIAVDGTGAVYVADTGNRRIVKFSGGGVYLGQWGTEGGSPGEFLAPRGIATDAANNVYVSDPGNDRIQKFTGGGVFLHEWGSAGTGPGQFNSPSGMAVDAAGNLYVADAGNNRIQVFDTAGVPLSQFGTAGTGAGQFQVPVGVAPGPGGRLYVADAGNNRIQVFDTNPLVPPPPPPPPGGLPLPAYGKTVNISLISGVVKIRLPGSRKFVLLSADLQIPVGTVIDASRGRVRLTSAKGPGGGTQSADFYSGIFKVLQPTGGKPVTVLKLQDPPVCGKTDHLMATASRRGGGLWGSGKGSFRSEGRHGSATVRGTIWWAQDTCKGTLFKVKKGVVTIEDFGSDRTLKLRAGQRYLAPAA